MVCLMQLYDPEDLFVIYLLIVRRQFIKILLLFYFIQKIIAAINSV